MQLRSFCYSPADKQVSYAYVNWTNLHRQKNIHNIINKKMRPTTRDELGFKWLVIPFLLQPFKTFAEWKEIKLKRTKVVREPRKIIRELKMDLEQTFFT